jgi:hypothetical protein
MAEKAGTMLTTLFTSMRVNRTLNSFALQDEIGKESTATAQPLSSQPSQFSILFKLIGDVIQTQGFQY